MWTKINDCGKQLSIHSRVREIDDNDTKVYDIIEVEYDQYKLELIANNGFPQTEKMHNVLSCEQLVRYSFEVEENENSDS